MLRSTVVAAVSAVVAAFAVVPAVQAQNIKIGIIGPMGFIQGEYHWAGAEMARDEINKAGGIRVGDARRMIEIVKADKPAGVWPQSEYTPNSWGRAWMRS